METQPVNYFYCHLFPTGVVVPDNTAVVNIAEIPVSPCVTTETYMCLWDSCRYQLRFQKLALGSDFLITSLFLFLWTVAVGWYSLLSDFLGLLIGATLWWKEILSSYGYWVLFPKDHVLKDNYEDIWPICVIYSNGEAEYFKFLIHSHKLIISWASALIKHHFLELSKH